MTYHNICLETTEDEHYRVLVWFDEEWHYVRKKYGAVVASQWDHLPEEEFLEHWNTQVQQYIDRAKLFGIEDIRGRQALAKAATTCMAFAASSVRLHGDLPLGGTASGTATPRGMMDE